LVETGASGPEGYAVEPPEAAEEDDIWPLFDGVGSSEGAVGVVGEFANEKEVELPM
jgi:hypothetical protein